MRLTSKPLALIILAAIFGGVLLTSAFGWWHTETNKIPATFSEGEAAGEYNPADIRGSYTFGDIEKSFGIPGSQLAVAFGLPVDANVSAFQVKELENLYTGFDVEIGTSSVRLFTAFYTGLPYDLSAEESYLPKPAADILIAHGNLSPERLAYLDTHTLDLTTQPTVIEIAPTPTLPLQTTPSADHTPEVEDGTIRGKTTFQELLDWGVPRERIEAVLGGAMPASDMLIKDYAAAQGLEFATLREALQIEVDAVTKK